MNKKLITAIFSFLAMVLFVTGCSKAMNNSINEIQQLQQEIDKMQAEINDLKGVIKDKQTEKTNNSDQPLNIDLKTMYFENGKCIILFDYLNLINSGLAFDIFIISKNAETKIAIPIIEEQSELKKKTYKLSFPVEKYSRIILRVHEINTGKMWQNEWDNQTDI